MFYVPELSLKGKGPLSRLWQASHSAKNVNRRIAAEFKYEDGYEAIVQPSNPEGFALRLRGKLLLGISRMHRAKVHYFSEDIQQTQDRLTLSFKVGNASVDLHTIKKSKTRVETITMAIDDDLDINFEISDELPVWLASDVLEIPLPIDQSKSNSAGTLRPMRLNMSDRASESAYGHSIRSGDILEDILEVSGGDLPSELDIDFISDSIFAPQKAHSNDFSSLHCPSIPEAAGDTCPENIAEIEAVIEQELALESPQKIQKRKRKGKLQIKSEIDRDTYRKWVSGLEEHIILITKRPRIAPYSHATAMHVTQLMSSPYVRVGNSLRNFLGNFGMNDKPNFLPPAEIVSEKSKKRNRKGRPIDDTSKAEDDIIWDPQDQDNGIEPYFGASASDSAGGSSFLNDWPERMRAGPGSDDSGQGFDLRLNSSKNRRSSEVQSLQSRFDLDLSPRGSSSILSRHSRLASVGEGDFLPPFSGMDEESYEGIFNDQMLQEEPDAVGTNISSTHQRLSNHDLLVARCVANELTKGPEQTASLFQLVGGRASAQQAARVFYSMLALQNDNIVVLDQANAFEDITISATANTAMYAYSTP